MNSLELVTIGDSTMDSFIFPTESETLCTIDQKECLVCFRYGDKIPVDNVSFSVGGNAANNAVGAARLGLNVGIITILGDDITGKNIYETLKNENLDLSFVEVVNGGKSNYSTVINYAGERTIFSYHSPKKYKLPKFSSSPKWIYLTSMGDGYESFFDEILEYKKISNTKIAFNPGSKQLRGSMAHLQSVLHVCDLLYVNREEAERIANFENSQNKEKELLSAVSALGPKTIIVTDGPSGAYVFNGQTYLYCPIFPQKAVSRTGAGDAFGSGTLAAIIKGETLETALVWGAVNSASVISKVGAQVGLLHEEQMAEWFQKAVNLGIMVKEL